MFCVTSKSFSDSVVELEIGGDFINCISNGTGEGFNGAVVVKNGFVVGFSESDHSIGHVLDGTLDGFTSTREVGH